MFFLNFVTTVISTNTKLDCIHLFVAAQILRFTSYRSRSDITRSMAAIGNIFKTRNISVYNEKPSAKISITTNFQNTKYIKNNSGVGKCTT